MEKSKIMNSKGFAYYAMLCVLSTGIHVSVSAQLNEEVGRLVQAFGDVTIVTNDGNEIKATRILTSAGEGGVPIKLGNKIITSEYSSAVILTPDENLHHLQEMTSMQFGTVSRSTERKSLSVIEKIVSFFTRQSGKEGDYRTDIVNTGWDDVARNVELGDESDV